ALDPSAVLRSQARGPGRLPRSAEDQPPALPRRVRVPLQAAPDTACRVRYAARYRRPYRSSSLPRADPQDRLVETALSSQQHVELPDPRAQAFLKNLPVHRPQFVDLRRCRTHLYLFVHRTRSYTTL